jgi:nucleotide-binding universal stress UspA family protein
VSTSQARERRELVHVLIATDGSDVSIAAARRGCALLAATEHVTLLSVMTEGDPGDDAGGIEGPVLSSSEQRAAWENELARARSELAATAASLTGVPVDEVVEVGDAADVICRVADRLGVDVVIVGSHGRGGLGRLFLGSVSEHVVRHAPCPVLVVREPRRD